MTQKEFEVKKQEALENMRKMNSRSKRTAEKPPVSHSAHNPENPKEKENRPTSKPHNIPLGTKLNLPFSNADIDPDTLLIMGLIFLLSTENCDKKLLFALMYILL